MPSYNTSFMPHGHCYLWQPGLMSLHFISDLLIGLAYLSISLSLYILVRRTKIPFQAIFLAFGIFIAACGVTHFMEVYTLWYPSYWTAGWIKAITAVASVTTALYLIGTSSEIAEVARRFRDLKLAKSRLDELYQTKLITPLEFHRLVNRTLLLPLILSLTLAGISIALASYLVIRNRAVIQVDGALVDVNNLQKLSIDAETGLRGYELTREDEFLTPYNNSTEQWPRVIKKIKSLLAYPEEKDRLADIDQRFTSWRDSALKAVNSLEKNTAISKASMRERKTQMDNLRTAFSNLLEQLENVKARQVAQSQSILALFVLVTLTLAVFVGSILAITGRRQLTEISVKYGVALQREQRQTQALADSVAQFKQVTESIPQLVWTANPSGEIDFYNSRWAEYTGRSAEELQAHGLQQVLHPDYVAPVLENLSQPPADLDVWENSFPILARSGEWRWFLSRATALRDENGKIQKWFGTNTDIEEQRRSREELAHALQLREDFLSIASHELRTPIAGLKIQLSLTERKLQKGDLSVLTTEGFSNVAHLCMRQVDQLSRLIDDMLDVSRISSGQFSLEMHEIDFSHLVAESLRGLNTQLDSAAVRLVTNIDEDLRVLGDPYRLNQVVTNLVTNAIKYGEGKPIEIQVSAAGDQVALRVKDQGMGIPPDYITRIFDRFERAISHKNISGLGLGLYICRQIVTAHNGQITAESRPGEGSIFEVKLARLI